MANWKTLPAKFELENDKALPLVNKYHMGISGIQQEWAGEMLLIIEFMNSSITISAVLVSIFIFF